jgi:hypothetical protein
MGKKIYTALLVYEALFPGASRFAWGSIISPASRIKSENMLFI